MNLQASQVSSAFQHPCEPTSEGSRLGRAQVGSPGAYKM